MEDLDALRGRWLGRIGEASDEAALESVRVSALGKKGEVSAHDARTWADDARGTQDRRPRSSTR
jgi:hypothetical protein